MSQSVVVEVEAMAVEDGDFDEATGHCMAYQVDDADANVTAAKEVKELMNDSGDGAVQEGTLQHQGLGAAWVTFYEWNSVVQTSHEQKVWPTLGR